MSKPERTRVGGSRWYKVDGNKYPSVTTVTGAYEPKKDALEQFEERVGEERAEEIKNYTAMRGTLVHHRILNPIAMRPLPLPEVDMGQITETLNEEIEICEAMWDDLDYDVGENAHVEKRLWSDEYGYAGTMDLLTEGGTVTDLKTSKPTWAPSPSQKMQVSAYFYASLERDFVPDPTDAAIVVLHPDPEFNQTLTAKVERLDRDEIDHWFDEFLGILSTFHE